MGGGIICLNKPFMIAITPTSGGDGCQVSGITGEGAVSFRICSADCDGSNQASRL